MSTAPTEPPRARRLWPWLVLLFLATSWPWLSNLTRWPMSADAPVWYERGDPAREDWREWVFETNHFSVGFRPVAALTYTAEHMLGDPNPLVLRTVDLGLHLAVVLALAALARRLAPGAGPPAALIAAAVFLLHPILEEVVPFASRRSYSLASLLALLGLTLAVAAARRDGGPGRRLLVSAASGALFALAMLTNEVSVVIVPVLPGLVWVCERPGAGRLARSTAACVGPAVLVGLALYVRQGVVEGVGGYSVDEEGAPPGKFFSSAWGWVLAVGLGKRTFLGRGPETLWTALTVAIVVHAALGAYLARQRKGSGYGLLVACLLVWAALPTLIYEALAVLYPRQVYACLAPWALLTGIQLATSWRHAAGAPRVVALALQALLLVGIVGSSPVLTGPDAEREAKWSARDAFIDDLLDGLESIEEPANVHLVMPTKVQRERKRTSTLHNVQPPEGGRRAERESKRVPSRDTRAPLRWAELMLGDRQIELLEWAYIEEEEWLVEDPPRLEREDIGWVLVVPAGKEIHAGRARMQHAGDDRQNTLVLKLRSPRKAYAFVYRRNGGELFELD